MKRATSIFALTFALLPVLATAQLGSGHKIVANVPFQFRVGDKHVPAGYCALEHMSAQTLIIMNVSAKASVLTSTWSQPSSGSDAAYTLVFHKYGDRYFLSGIKQAGQTIDRLRESSAERELRAQNGPATEEVLLASRK